MYIYIYLVSVADSCGHAVCVLHTFMTFECVVCITTAPPTARRSLVSNGIGLKQSLHARPRYLYPNTWP